MKSLEEIWDDLIASYHELNLCLNDSLFFDPNDDSVFESVLKEATTTQKFEHLYASIDYNLKLLQEKMKSPFTEHEIQLSNERLIRLAGEIASMHAWREKADDQTRQTYKDMYQKLRENSAQLSEAITDYNRKNPEFAIHGMIEATRLYWKSPKWFKDEIDNNFDNVEKWEHLIN